MAKYLVCDPSYVEDLSVKSLHTIRTLGDGSFFDTDNREFFVDVGELAVFPKETQLNHYPPSRLLIGYGAHIVELESPQNLRFSYSDYSIRYEN